MGPSFLIADFSAEFYSTERKKSMPFNNVSSKAIFTSEKEVDISQKSWEHLSPSDLYHNREFFKLKEVLKKKISNGRKLVGKGNYKFVML